MSIFLSNEEITLIANESNIEEEIVRRWHADFMALCPNGRMNKKNFGKFYKLLRSETADKDLSKISDHVFRCFDKDSSGYLEFAEFMVAYSSTSSNDVSKKLDFVFSFYDKDKDGLVSDKEFLYGVELMYKFRGIKKKDYSPQNCVKDIFTRMDTDGDKKLSKQEFIDACLLNDQILALLSPFEY